MMVPTIQPLTKPGCKYFQNLIQVLSFILRNAELLSILLLPRSRTPGNRIVYLYTKKVGIALKSTCGVCPGQLQGVCAVRPKVLYEVV